MNQTTNSESLQRGTSTNPYCGPAALALLMNKPLDEVDEILKEKLGTSIQKGLFYPLMLQILQEQGYKYHLTTKRTFVKSENDGNYLIVFKEHFGVAKKGFYYDNSMPRGTEHFPRLRIERVYQVCK